MTVLWVEKTWMEIRDELAAGAPVLIPVGCVEEHGPHLPTGTDLFQAYHVCVETAERVSGLVLPPLHHGQCSSTRNFPGSISLSASTLRSMFIEILEGVIRSGAGKIMIVTGHAGSVHMASIKDACRETVEMHPTLKLWFLTDYDIAEKITKGNDEFNQRDGHAGDIETSRMLHINPSIVKEIPVGGPPGFEPFRVIPDPETCFPDGLMADPTLASADKGREVNDAIVEKLVELLMSDQAGS